MAAFPFDSNIHSLKLGNSFDPRSQVGFHSMRYDFKPASVDTGRESHVEVAGSQVTVTVPHVEGSSTSHTVFKGNTQPTQRECVLIIDHEKGTYTLEKLSNKINVKKSRLDGTSKSTEWFQQHGRVTPGVDKKRKKKPSPKDVKAKSQPPTSSHSEKNSPERDNFSITPLHSEASKGAEDIALVGEISDSSDSSSSSSDDEDDAPSYASGSKPLPSQAPGPVRGAFGVLNNDLALSESGSDSDSD